MVSDDQDALHDLSGDLTRLVAETHAGDAARARARERSLRQQATEDATFVGLLFGLAEAASPVSLRTRIGHTIQGVIDGLGRDFALVRASSGRLTLVKLSVISTIRSGPGQQLPDPTEHRAIAEGTTLAAHLATLAPERPRVAVAVDGEQALLTGTLRAVGTDVVTLELEGGRQVTAYVALASLCEVVLLASG